MLGLLVLLTVAVAYLTRPRPYEGKTAALYAFDLTDPDPKVREQAEAAVRRSGTTLVPGFGALLLSRDATHRRLVWDNVLRLPRLVKPFLLTRVKPPDARRLRGGAARGLALLGPQATPAIPKLERALAQNSLPEVIEVNQALIAIGPDAVPVLVRALQHSTPSVRALAATSLGTMGLDGIAGAPALVRLLADPDPQLRAAATYALTSQQAAVLKRLVAEADNPDGNTRMAAVAGLMTVQRALHPLQSALIKLTRDPDPAVRQQALERLQQPRQPGPPIPVFLSSLDDPDASVRVAAVSGLGAFANLPAVGVEQLRRMLADPEPRVREAVARLMESRALTNSAHTTSTKGASPAN